MYVVSADPFSSENLADGATSAPVPVQLTSGNREAGKSCGVPDFIAQEEMGRYSGFWWAPDSQHLAFEGIYPPPDPDAYPAHRIAWLT